MSFWRVTSTPDAFASSPAGVTLLATVLALHTVMPLVVMEFEALVPPAVGHDFRVALADLRVWRQTLVLANNQDVDPFTTFTSVAGAWRRSEIAKLDAVQAAVLVARGATTMTRIEVRVVP